MSASVWVPLVTAAAGLVAGLATGLGTTFLTRRWASEDRRAAWQREDRLRWQSDRLQVYARMISGLDAWDTELRRARDRREAGEPFDATEWERHDGTVTELVGLLHLMAPDEVRTLARRCLWAFSRAGQDVAGEEALPDKIHSEALEAAGAAHRLSEAMREDLGLGGDGRP